MNIVDINNFILAGGRRFERGDYFLLRTVIEVGAWRFIGKSKITGDVMRFETGGQWFEMNNEKLEIREVK